MFDVRALHQFVRVVSAGSFARAASELGLTQPALSKSVRKLEREMKVRLVERTARGVTPTEFGEALLLRVRPILSELAVARKEIEAMRGGPGGVVSIGVAPAVAAHFIPGALDLLAQSGQAAIRARIVEGLADFLIAELRTGNIHFALTTLPQAHEADDLNAEPLFADVFVPCAGATHPMARRRAPDPAELAAFPWVLAPRQGVLRREFNARFRERNLVAPEAMVETGSVLLSRELIRCNRFLSFLPRDLLNEDIRRGDVAVLSLPWLRWIRQVCLLTRRDQVLPASCVQALAAVREVSRKRKDD
ncbi:MAG: LysR family transcriptional regulator [Burkholderiaceae bacterium]|nr:LysR family transcriptional regulator [Burkholderiaceae bacterium]